MTDFIVITLSLSLSMCGWACKCCFFFVSTEKNNDYNNVTWHLNKKTNARARARLVDVAKFFLDDFVFVLIKFDAENWWDKNIGHQTLILRLTHTHTHTHWLTIVYRVFIFVFFLFSFIFLVRGFVLHKNFTLCFNINERESERGWIRATTTTTVAYTIGDFEKLFN